MFIPSLKIGLRFEYFLTNKIICEVLEGNYRNDACLFFAGTAEIKPIGGNGYIIIQTKTIGKKTRIHYSNCELMNYLELHEKLNNVVLEDTNNFVYFRPSERSLPLYINKQK